MHANPLAEPATFFGGIYGWRSTSRGPWSLLACGFASQILLCSGASRSVYLDLCGGSINLKQFIRGELDFQGSKVLVQTFKLARAGDGNNPWLLGQWPAER